MKETLLPALNELHEAMIVRMLEIADGNLKAEPIAHQEQWREEGGYNIITQVLLEFADHHSASVKTKA